MAPRTTPSRLAALVLASLVIGAACPAAPARGAGGNGLYEPFPEAAVKKRAQRYVERLSERTAARGRRITDAQLAAGVFVRPDHGGPALSSRASTSGGGAASARAGTEGSADTALAVQILLAILALALPAWALTARSRAHAT